MTETDTVIRGGTEYTIVHVGPEQPLWFWYEGTGPVPKKLPGRPFASRAACVNDLNLFHRTFRGPTNDQTQEAERTDGVSEQAKGRRGRGRQGTGEEKKDLVGEGDGEGPAESPASD